VVTRNKTCRLSTGGEANRIVFRETRVIRALIRISVYESWLFDCEDAHCMHLMMIELKVKGSEIVLEKRCH